MTSVPMFVNRGVVLMRAWSVSTHTQTPAVPVMLLSLWTQVWSGESLSGPACTRVCPASQKGSLLRAGAVTGLRLGRGLGRSLSYWFPMRWILSGEELLEADGAGRALPTQLAQAKPG